MKRRYTDKEISAILEQITIIADTREQVWAHLQSSWSAIGVPYEQHKLGQGDYTGAIPASAFPGYENVPGMQSLENEIVVERKANLDELAGNFTVDRERFEREFIRAQAKGIKVFLVIENASWQDIFSHNYKSKLNPQSLYGSLLAWQAKYNLTVIFCRPEESARIIYGLFYYWLKAKLEG